MVAVLMSFIACYLLGVLFWYILRFYFSKRRIHVNNYYAFIASVFSIIAITIITRLIGVKSDGCIISGIVTMGLFSLDKNPVLEPNYRGKILLFMFIGTICAGFISALLSQAAWLN